MYTEWLYGIIKRNQTFIISLYETYEHLPVFSTKQKIEQLQGGFKIV